jgi:hypothetical protein
MGASPKGQKAVMKSRFKKTGWLSPLATIMTPMQDLGNRRRGSGSRRDAALD